MEPGQESIRVLARNIRAKETQADWMIWADADMVYHKEFFADLKNKVSQEPVLSCTQVMGADRHSLNIPFCVNYFNEDKREYPCIIDNVAELVSTWPDWRFGGKHIAAGYFQLANVQAIKNKVEAGPKTPQQDIPIKTNPTLVKIAIIVETNIIDGGLDSVRDLGSRYPVHIIDNGDEKELI